MQTASTPLATVLSGSPYQGYTYAYPHKTAYRPLIPPVPLDALWEAERRDALFLYLHVPFCEMRCGFCNLFTTANPKEDFTAAYLRALRRQAAQVKNAVGNARFARFAMGGGTPTYLSVTELETLFNMVTDVFGVEAGQIPASVETSPRTANPEKLRLLRERGVDRISIGIQSFLEAEVAASGRAQKPEWVEGALEGIRNAGFPTLNIDLIYGLPGQTVASWLASLQSALRWQPEELFLYPLYVRPLTGLGRRHQKEGTRMLPLSDGSEDIRLACYRAGRDLLLANGYAQISMRMFARRWDTSRPDKPDVAYCCQQDGMVGVGCGARSYTHGLHYASEYAVGATGVRDILRDYVARPDASFATADYGMALSPDEQRRRHLIQSLLQVAGLDTAAYQERFGSLPTSDFPELRELESNGLAEQENHILRLTAAGIERSDTIGPWLYSQSVQERMLAYELR